MNYLVLKNIIAKILETFQCPKCASKASENMFHIQSVTERNLNLIFVCQTCHEKLQFRAEVGKTLLTKLSPEESKNFLQQISTEQEKTLSEEDVSEIQKKFSTPLTVKDLIDDEK